MITGTSLNRPEEAAAVVIASCNACDPKSNLPHAFQITRLNVANLCCSGEERLIKSLLVNKKGVEAVEVNIVGRSVAVKHCPVDCCTPCTVILDVLNSKNLGASLSELDEDDIEEMQNDKVAFAHLVSIFHAFMVGAMFIAGIIVESFSDDDNSSMAIFVMSVGVGCVRVLHDAALSILWRGILDMNCLMLVAIAGAFGSGDYIDASLLVSLFLIAETIEDAMMRYVRRTIKTATSAGSSGGGQPKKATLLGGRRVPIDEIKIGDTVTVRAGEMIPVDGVVTKGEGSVDESSLTGEATPLHKQVSLRVTSGTILQVGYIEVRVDVAINECTIRRLHQTLIDVQADKGYYGRIVDDFSVYWTPFVLASAVSILLIGGGVTGQWNDYFMRALVLLVLACPCALVISAPIPSVCAIASAARHGVLIRGCTVIEQTGTVNCVAFDKTGTLTHGQFKVTDRLLISDAAIERDFDPLEFAAALEEKSAHPIASAVVSAYCGCIADFGGSLPKVNKPVALEGVGVSGWLLLDDDWKYTVVGNDRVLTPKQKQQLQQRLQQQQSGSRSYTTIGIATTHTNTSINAEKPFDFLRGGDRNLYVGKVSLSPSGEAKVLDFITRNPCAVILYVCVEDELAMVLALSDDVREGAAETVLALRNLGMSVSMLTGDASDVAASMCGKVGIDLAHCHSRLLPAHKLAWVRGTDARLLGCDESQVPTEERNNGTPAPSIGHSDDDSSTRRQREQGQHERVREGDASGSDISDSSRHERKDDNSRDKPPTHLQQQRLPEKRRVMMVGDGVNDSAALSAAACGVAMGAGGSAMAVAAADVVILSDNLTKLPLIVSLCRRARMIIIQNCAGSIVVKIAAIALASLGYLNLWEAVFIDVGNLILVVFNGLRLLRPATRIEAFITLRWEGNGAGT